MYQVSIGEWEGRRGVGGGELLWAQEAICIHRCMVMMYTASIKFGHTAKVPIIVAEYFDKTTSSYLYLT